MGGANSSQKQKTTQTSKVSADISTNLDWKQQIQTEVQQEINKSQTTRNVQDCTGMGVVIDAGQQINVSGVHQGGEVVLRRIRNIQDLSTVDLICAHKSVQNPTTEAGIMLRQAQQADMAAGISNDAQNQAIQQAVQQAESTQSALGAAGSLGGLTSMLPIIIVAFIVMVLFMILF